MTKKTILLITIVLLSIGTSAQNISDFAESYLKQFRNHQILYRDAIVHNADNQSKPPQSENITGLSFYYNCEHTDDEVLVMISNEYTLNNLEFIEYYIYNEFQELQYFIFESGYMKRSYKILEDKIELVEYYTYQEIADSDYIFDYKGIKEKSNYLISYLDLMWELPNYEKQADFVLDQYQKIIRSNELKREKTDTAVRFYDKEELVKIVVKDENITEFYLYEGELVFSYSHAFGTMPECRCYYYKGIAFRCILGKEAISKNVFEFYEFSTKYLEVFKKHYKKE